ncbi:hypothetical protein GCM10010387_29470 [Streptomyces inusitatus]|uniref:Uncharacterized protein n=1 Tax=Streptomyces inusitatus TaxID=68221 RepID=A0A918Q792_9ACTN|nr:hypothetical protein GCM10010387_29470 [Streptomyces inusitatus]
MGGVQLRVTVVSVISTATGAPGWALSSAWAGPARPVSNPSNTAIPVSTAATRVSGPRAGGRPIASPQLEVTQLCTASPGPIHASGRGRGLGQRLGGVRGEGNEYEATHIK